MQCECKHGTEGKQATPYGDVHTQMHQGRVQQDKQGQSSGERRCLSESWKTTILIFSSTE